MADVADLAAELRDVVETWEDDPARLEEVRARRQLLHELKRKYGPTLDDVVAFAEEGRHRLAALAAEERGRRRSTARSPGPGPTWPARRRRWPGPDGRRRPLLASEIEATLHAWPCRRPGSPSRWRATPAATRSRFELAANPGEPALPLAKAASGGELSRTMLAVRLALTDAPGVLVFDEVDAGVGGQAAIAVGTALAGLGHYAQVLVVTHLAQVAAQADHQIEVRKVESDGRTRSEVTVLDPDGRVVEISRMLSGSPDSQAAHRHARELLGARRAGPGPGRTASDRAGSAPPTARRSGSLTGCPMRMAPT